MGERLLTTDNPEVERDRQLFERLGLRLQAEPSVHVAGAHGHT